MRALVRRYARTHGPFPTAQLAERYGVDPSPALRELEAEGAMVRGELLPGGTEREWCDSEVLRRVRRASLARLRKEVEAADTRELARFLPSWQNVDAFRRTGAGLDRLREALVPLQGVALTPKVWEGDVLPRRLGAYSPSWLDELCTSGELVWIGAGALGRNDGRVALYFREDVRLAGPPPANAKLESPEGEVHDAIRERLAAGPSFWLDLVVELDHPAEDIHNALWDLVWSGAGDQRRLRAAARAAPAGGAALRTPRPPLRPPPLAPTGAAVQGRWSLTEPLFANAPGPGAKLRAPGRADARALRDRHPRDRPRRGRPRRLLDPLRGARQPRAARHRPPRLLRRGPRRRPVRPPRRGRAPALAARTRRLLPRPRRHRPGQPLRRLAALAEARGRPPRRPHPRRPPAAARRRAAGLRRARRPRHCCA